MGVPLEYVSVFIALCAMLVGFAGVIGSLRKDEGKRQASFSHLDTSLAFIGDDTKEIKSELRGMRADVAEVRRIALEAQASAESAHKRLDIAGIATSQSGGGAHYGER